MYVIKIGSVKASLMAFVSLLQPLAVVVSLIFGYSYLELLTFKNRVENIYHFVWSLKIVHVFRYCLIKLVDDVANI